MRESVPPEALLDAVPPQMAAIADRLRALIKQVVPGTVEKVRTGWRVIGFDASAGRRAPYFAWVMVESAHVHLGFVYGTAMADLRALLDGDATRARWLTFTTIGELDDPGEDVLAGLILEARRVALLGRGERELATVSAAERAAWKFSGPSPPRDSGR